MRFPTDVHPLPGSERHRPSASHRLGPADPKEVLSITISLRRRSDALTLPDQAFWTATAPIDRVYISRKDWAKKYAATGESVKLVTEFAKAEGLKVLQIDRAQRIIILSGTVKKINHAFSVDLGQYQNHGENYRGREGYIYLPRRLANIVEGVFGLDNRRMAHRQTVRGKLSSLTPHRVIGFV